MKAKTRPLYRVNYSDASSPIPLNWHLVLPTIRVPAPNHTKTPPIIPVGQTFDFGTLGCTQFPCYPGLLFQLNFGVPSMGLLWSMCVGLHSIPRPPSKLYALTLLTTPHSSIVFVSLSSHFLGTLFYRVYQLVIILWSGVILFFPTSHYPSFSTFIHSWVLRFLSYFFSASWITYHPLIILFETLHTVLVANSHPFHVPINAPDLLLPFSPFLFRVLSTVSSHPGELL